MKRKLTTILFADAQGYSTLMASDETTTLDRLNRYRSIMADLFARHDGRQVIEWPRYRARIAGRNYPNSAEPGPPETNADERSSTYQDP
jgi:class 3 adenylate cyclase